MEVSHHCGLSGNRILATAEPPCTRVGIMELWGCSLLLLAMLFMNQAQLKRQRFRELDPVRGEIPRFPGSPGTGEPWFALGGVDCPFSLPMWALLMGLSGSAALYVLRFRGRGGVAPGPAPEAQPEEAFLRDVATVLAIIRGRLSRAAQEQQRPLQRGGAGGPRAE
ncbi:uncharacterized protein LOC143826322 [Paroedura picta]|uniref:uncharacterized protein LOC143826322 n=1 Tax=Paroedura picta TaxID=143630 RepID=UPI00101435E9